MKSTYLTNIILLILIIGLYWFVNQEESPVSSATNLFSLSPHDVSNITIQRQDRDEIALRKQDNNWHITQPFQADANAVRIKLLLNVLNSVPYRQFKPEKSTQLKQFNLAPAPITLHLNDHVFHFGDIEPLSKHRYVYHQESIYLFDDAVVPLLNSSASSFIDNHLIAHNQSLTKLTLPSITLKLENGHWKSNDNLLSTDTLTATISTWQNAQAMQVLSLSSGSLTDLTGDTVTLEFDNHNTQTLILQQDKYSISLTDPTKKLHYQFPIALLAKLIPTHSTSP